MNKLTPFLWFNDQAEQAAEFYLSVFPGAKKLDELRATSAGPGPAGSVLTVAIEMMGQQVTLLNGGPHFKLNEAFSFVVRCADQAEIDHWWAVLTADGGAESQCGWCKDRFGVSWQVVPEHTAELLRSPGAMKAMMGMKKFDIAALKAAGA